MQSLDLREIYSLEKIVSHDNRNELNIYLPIFFTVQTYFITVQTPDCIKGMGGKYDPTL